MMETGQDVIAGGGSEGSLTGHVRPRTRNLRDIVELYVRSRLPRNIHPSYGEVSAIEIERARPALPPTSQTEPVFRSVVQQAVDQHGRDATTETFSIAEIYQEAESESDRFKSILESYERDADPKYKTDVTLQGVNHTWEEVLDEVNQAASQYKDKSGIWAKIRRGMRKVGESSQAFAGWLELLPTDSEYFSIICGGLKLIIKAATRIKDVRESIFDAIANIPALLNNTKMVSGIFKQSKELHQCSSALYITTLATLDHIVTWLRQNAAKKGLKAFFRQEGYEKALTVKIAAMKTASDHFAKAAAVCSYQKQDDIHTDIRQTKSEVQLNRLAIQDARRESVRNQETLDSVIQSEAKETREDLNLKVARLEDQNTQLRTELTTKLDSVLKTFLSSNQRVNPKTNDLRGPPIPTKSLSARLTRRAKVHAEALDVLNHDSSVLATDMKLLLRIAWTLPKPAQDRAVSLMQSPCLHDWLRNPFSSILFVNGNFSTSARQSPLSFVCAKLMDSLHPTGDVPRVKDLQAQAFFCGQHLNPSDPDTGVAGLMQSLLAQLLIYPDQNFKVATVDKISKIDPSDVTQLCAIYFSLISQLPSSTTIFCLVDALTFHEDNKRRCKEAITVIQTFVDLMEDPTGSQRCIFKALLTCPGASRVLYKEITRKEDVVWMPKKVSAQGGFTSMKWSASAGRDVGELAAVGSW